MEFLGKVSEEVEWDCPQEEDVWFPCMSPAVLSITSKCILSRSMGVLHVLQVFVNLLWVNKQVKQVEHEALALLVDLGPDVPQEDFQLSRQCALFLPQSFFFNSKSSALWCWEDGKTLVVVEGGAPWVEEHYRMSQVV